MSPLYEYIQDGEGVVLPGIGGVFKGLVVDSTKVPFDITNDPRFILAPVNATVDPISVVEEVFTEHDAASAAQANADVAAHLQ